MSFNAQLKEAVAAKESEVQVLSEKNDMLQTRFDLAEQKQRQSQEAASEVLFISCYGD